MKPVLILGAKGLLGEALSETFPSAILWDKEDLDVTDFPKLHNKFIHLNNNISAIINCVAYNDVNGAESNNALAFLLNAEVPKQLALLSNACRVPLVHISTGYVFDGQKDTYDESDIPQPISVYGASKLKGEELLAEQGGRYYIIRTNCIFGKPGTSEASKKTFVQIVQSALASGDAKDFVSDEVNSFTYAHDLAIYIQLLLEKEIPFGLYHIVNSGQASWYEFAKEVQKYYPKSSAQINPVSRSAFARVAQRPARAVLLNTKLPVLRSWQEALKEFLTNHQN